MAEPAFSHQDDDLPRTLRRERDARQRNAQAAAQPAYGAAGRGSASLDLPGDGVTVTRFDVPFFRLMFFMIKCVLASIPALLLLGGLLYGTGEVLKRFFPWLLKMEILVKFLG